MAVVRPRGAPEWYRRAQRARHALPGAGSVSCPPAHISSSSTLPPAIGAERDASAGRGGGMRGGRARPTRARKARPQGRARGEPAAQVPWAAPQPMAVVRACWTDGRPARRPRGVHGARLSSRRGLRVAHGRSDGTMGTTGERSCARKPPRCWYLFLVNELEKKVNELDEWRVAPPRPASGGRR